MAALSLGAACAFALPRWEPYRWLHGDGAFYYNVSLGLLDHGSLRQDGWHPESWYRRDMGWNRDLDAAFSNVALGRDGTAWWPKHPWLLPVVAAPFVFAAGPWGALALNTLLLVGVALAAFRVALRVAPPWPAFAAATLLAVSVALAAEAWSFSNDLFYTLPALWAFEAALAGRSTRAGVLLGVAVVAKFTMVLLIPALLLLVFRGREWRRAGAVLAGLAGPAALLMAANLWMFGHPLKTGYHRVLVMEGGRPVLHSTALDFGWGGLWPALQETTLRILEAFPALPLVAGGLVVLAWRRRGRESAALGLAVATVVVFHAPFTWFRTAFVLPALGLSVPLLAAAFAGGRPPGEAPPLPGRRHAAAAGAVLLLLLLGGATRRLTAAPQATLAETVPQARVHLGSDPCDYFNPQVSGWECAVQDRGDARLMTGALVSPRLRYDGEVRHWVRLSPHRSGRPRTITWSVPPGTSGLQVAYGVADGAAGAVRFRIRAGETVLLDTRAEPGLQQTSLPVPSGTGSLTFEVHGRRPLPFGFDGRLSRGPPPEPPRGGGAGP